MLRQDLASPTRKACTTDLKTPKLGTVKNPLKPERCLTGLDNFDNIRAVDGILPPLTQFNAGIMPSMLV